MVEERQSPACPAGRGGTKSRHETRTAVGRGGTKSRAPVGRGGTKSRHETPHRRWSRRDEVPSRDPRPPVHRGAFRTGRLSDPFYRIEHMSETLEAGPEAEAEVDDDLSPAGLLASIQAARTAENSAAARQLTLAAQWADLHPPESIHSAATFTVRGCEHEEPIAGVGCPTVAEFCVAELGGVLGISTTAAKRLMGHSLELRHRLPRLWAQVQSGRVPAWRARAVAEVTIHTAPALTPEAAGWVDSQVAAVAGKVGTAQLDRLVAEAIRRFELAEADPTQDPDDGWQHVDPRHVTIDRDDVHFAGTLHLEADLDIADALDLDRELTHSAAVQKALGSAASLNVRRAKALGDLARTQTALDLYSQGHAAPSSSDGLPVAREVVLHAHFNAWTEGDATVFGPHRAARGTPTTGPPRPGPLLVLATPGPRSPSGPSSTSTPSCQRRGMRSRTGSASRSSCATGRVCSRGAPDPRVVSMSTTSSRTTTTADADRQTPTRPHDEQQPCCVVSVPPPAQDPLRLALPDGRTRESSSGPAPTATATDETGPAPPPSTHPIRPVLPVS